jgi:two-component system sensor histidine kinase YesM
MTEDLPLSTKTKLGGVGLKNVDRRIKLFCGESYGLEIQSQKNQGTKVTLKLCKS